LFFLSDKIGKEIISRFHIPFYKNNQTFYTDSNGREMLKRVLNYRPSFSLKENVENVSGNYYPITSRISLTDLQTRFSILNDRSQGGSSLQDGEIELMVLAYVIYIIILVVSSIILRYNYNDFKYHS
jgi:lysosomal alpha-mannosidase